MGGGSAAAGTGCRVAVQAVAHHRGISPGSSPDLTARTFADPLARALGQPVVVENKVGASGNIGADAVAKATDGHTIGLFINVNFTIAKLVNPSLPFDPHKDLAPLSLVGVSPLVLTAPVAQAGVPTHADARTFLEAARQAGDRWSYGTPGVGTMGHIGTELLKARTGIAPVHVPYPGYPQVAMGMLGGRLQMALLPPALAVAQQRSGKLQLLGVTSAGRSSLVPGIPSLAEAGVKDFQWRSGMPSPRPRRCPPPTGRAFPRRSPRSPGRRKCARRCSSRAGRWPAPPRKDWPAASRRIRRRWSR